MWPKKIVVDTNVLLSGLRSKRGTSHKLLTLIGVSGKFQTNLSVPLVLEYEDVAKRFMTEHGLSGEDIDAIIDYICSVSLHHRIHYLWRPFLRDPKDDMVLELAVVSECDFIVTFNEKDFATVEKAFGIKTVRPLTFLREIEEL